MNCLLSFKLYAQLSTFCLVLLAIACSRDSIPTAPSGLETAATPTAAVTESQLQVFKTPTCGCCGDWIKHMERSGFEAHVFDRESLADLKAQYGLSPAVQSCHTAVIDGYVFEGHIPADVVRRFLQAPPAGARGLAVPGMPIGSPGMEMDDRFDAYDVLVLQTDGSVAVYEHISAQDSRQRAQQ